MPRQEFEASYWRAAPGDGARGLAGDALELGRALGHRAQQRALGLRHQRQRPRVQAAWPRPARALNMARSWPSHVRRPAHGAGLLQSSRLLHVSTQQRQTANATNMLKIPCGVFSCMDVATSSARAHLCTPGAVASMHALHTEAQHQHNP